MATTSKRATGSVPAPDRASVTAMTGRKNGVVSVTQQFSVPDVLTLALDDTTVKTWYAPTAADLKRNSALKPFRGTERQFFERACQAGNYPMEALVRDGATTLARRIYTGSLARKASSRQGVFGSARATIAAVVEGLIAAGVDPATIKPSQILKASDGKITSFRSVERYMRVNGIGIPPKRIDNIEDTIAAIKDAWKEAVPEPLRDTTEPADISRKALRVRCFTREAVHRIALETSAILKAIAEAVPAAAALETLRSTYVKPTPKPKPMPVARARRGATPAKAKRATVKRHTR